MVNKIDIRLAFSSEAENEIKNIEISLNNF